MVNNRLICPACKNVFDTAVMPPNQIQCPKCRTTFPIPSQGLLKLYRMGNFMGSAAPASIYINEQPCGFLANQGSINIPLNYGTYKIHMAMGMNRRCNDPVIQVTPDKPLHCYKMHIKMGAFSNTQVLEEASPMDMPQ